MNMSYCRFRNTASDLRDCADGILDDLSPIEHEARRTLIELCREIVEAADRNPDLCDELSDGKEFA